MVPATPVGRSPSAGEIDELHRRLVDMARDRNWSGLANAMKVRDDLLTRVTPTERAAIFQSAVLCNERILQMVRSSRQSVRTEFLELRKRRDVAGRYESLKGVGKEAQ